VSDGEVGEPARALLSQVAADGYGSVSPSVYETGRLVRAARWLDGHKERLAYLLRSQRPDGGWGAPGGYGLVPTLSATDALLSEVDADAPAVDRGRLVDAASRGLHALFRWLGEHRPASTPDTIAVEFLVPCLVAEINGWLARRSAGSTTGLDAWRGDAHLPVPSDVDATMLAKLRDATRQGRPVPAKVWHSVEVLGADIRHARTVMPTDGHVGGSPAATAGWLAGRPGDRDAAAVAYLRTAQARHGGPVSSILPITVFERAWVLSTLAGAGVPMAAPRGLTAHLHATFGEFGAPAGVGLPPDSDDTAGALHALALTGTPRPVDPLWAYQSDSYFHCFIGERTPSTSTNAHILDALLDAGMVAAGEAGHRRRLAVGKIVRWLLDMQEPDGCWWDKWHASPYYATACCVSALAGTGDPAVAPALRRAVAWVIGSQRADGSCGRWQGTVEETAYAVRVLSSAGPAGRTAAAGAAVARGGEWLAGQPDDAAQWPPLWHDKDLYTPVAVVRAARIAALHLTAEHSAAGDSAGARLAAAAAGG
jgi:halimadienyl-diphosphate synthase